MMVYLARGGALFYWDESSGVTTRAVAASSRAGASIPESLTNNDVRC